MTFFFKNRNVVFSFNLMFTFFQKKKAFKSFGLILENPFFFDKKLFVCFNKQKACSSKSNGDALYAKEKTEAWNYYISGFVDGEGCFTVSFRFLSKLKTGIEVRPSFSLAQKKSLKNYRLLKNIRDTFGVGAIRDDKKGCYKYETRSLTDIKEKIIPFFKRYPLYTDKQESFQLFKEICSRMEKKEHLTKKGLKEILTLSKTLNPSGTRRFSLLELNESIF